MRERLFETINKAREKCGTSTNCRKCSGYGKGSRCISALIADELLADGWMRPPCKVGDTVYMIQTLPLIRGVVELTVENLVIGINPNKCRLYCKHNSGSKDVFYEDSFGRILFFTYEEAEAALRKEDERE